MPSRRDTGRLTEASACEIVLQFDPHYEAGK
jgi:hypothetical protein